MNPSQGQPFGGLRSGRLLEGRTVLISGAGRARGIGKATARLCVEHGARVAMLDLDQDEVRLAAADVAEGRDVAIGIRCDVTDRSSCEQAVAQALAWGAAQGRIDVLINNAGLTQKRKVAEITDADYALVTDVVLRGTILLSQAVLPTMRAQGDGSIVSVSSMSAQQGGGVFGGPHYCAAKAGVLGFTRSLALELGPEGIRANAVTPGLIITDFSRTNRSDEEKDASAQGWPMRRAGRPVELASACLFLASDLSSYVTGITLDVNGGAYMR
ncbi:SDR family NAD(P)-dependent oxidoreductase [Xylophilus sp. GOD-11R]|uniref:SDR family NAD(P)-dependent oxidoreductase n=1 Tax=Xylophilus sp. GOD-11R TaxID=3089814 RepID=UPI00298C44B9|nr:SDR family NAD(P)-dependent oxidoreductase [Xylophilus sp. GOD-11R]WPB59496.1 SDR family NAD(P)-dependent oxidoreductase [Xylophilus sp. GOD-11R]